jgi:energy-coupling factor transporter transmembrane protein EcfT
MLCIHPLARLLSALLLAIAIFAATSIVQVLLAYVMVLSLVLLTGVAWLHARFVVLISSPLLIALIAVWGWAANAAQIPLPHTTGAQYALLCWLRIVAAAGVLQCLFVPLVEQPKHLPDFLGQAHLQGSLGTLIVTSIVFLPEVRRRLDRIVDARKAQGYSMHGFSALLELPHMLMPLVSSLLESSARRAELWSHRGILEGHGVARETSTYSRTQSALAMLVSCAASAAIWLS